MTRVFLLRHGATAANLEVPYRLQGRKSDRPLDDIGQRQVEAAGRALANSRLVAVYTSPLLRAIQTAEAIARPHGVTPAIETGLIEADIGEWEGLTWDEAGARHPDHYAKFLERPGTTPYPGGESFQDAGRRAATAIARLVQKHDGESIAVVAHNILNRGYLAPILGVSIEKAREIRQSNAGISLVEVAPAGTVLVQLNSVLHLDGLL